MSTNGVSPAREHAGVVGGILARAAQIGMMFVLIAGLLFGAAGTLDWAWAWLYLGIYLASVAINAWFLRRSPELVAERGRPAEPMHAWDRWLGGLWAAAEFLAIPLVAGLDMRFGWTGAIDAVWHLLGAIAFAAGLGLFGWAMVTNAYFSTAARIQRDRGQTVCRSGPYRFVRHPGYTGSILQSLGSPLVLGSAWALVPAVIAAAAVAARTWFEDRMLRAELPGYDAYAGEVSRRLMPLVW